MSKQVDDEIKITKEALEKVTKWLEEIRVQIDTETRRASFLQGRLDTLMAVKTGVLVCDSTTEQ